MALYNRLIDNLPIELIERIAFDIETIVILEAEALKNKHYDIYDILERKRKKIIGYDVDKYAKLLYKYKDLPKFAERLEEYENSLNEWALADHLYKVGDVDKAFEMVPDNPKSVWAYVEESNLGGKFQALARLGRWDVINNMLTDSGTFRDDFELIRNLPERDLIREHLDDEKNLTMMFLLDSEGTDINEWIEKGIIDDWLTGSENDPILRQMSFRFRKPFILWHMYDIAGDPRRPRRDSIKDEKLIMDTLGYLGFDRSMWMTAQPEGNELLSYRGSPEGFRDLVNKHIERYLGDDEEDDDNFTPFPPEARLVFLIYPEIYEEFRDRIYFADREMYDVHPILDLIRYKDQNDLAREWSADISREFESTDVDPDFIYQQLGVDIEE